MALVTIFAPSLIAIEVKNYQIGYGVKANIAASHAAARGSIPRIRIIFYFHGSTISTEKDLPLRVRHHSGEIRGNQITHTHQISSETVIMHANSIARLGQTLFQQGMCGIIICIAI
jgi:hypothetical protein